VSGVYHVFVRRTSFGLIAPIPPHGVEVLLVGTLPSAPMSLLAIFPVVASPSLTNTALARMIRSTRSRVVSGCAALRSSSWSRQRHSPWRNQALRVRCRARCCSSWLTISANSARLLRNALTTCSAPCRLSPETTTIRMVNRGTSAANSVVVTAVGVVLVRHRGGQDREMGGRPTSPETIKVLRWTAPRHRVPELGCQQPKPEPSVTQYKRIAIDTSKAVFNLHGIDQQDRPVLRVISAARNSSRFFAKLPTTEIAMEACGGAHHWARGLTARSHEIRLSHLNTSNPTSSAPRTIAMTPRPSARWRGDRGCILCW
jgi:hypothetical protein